MNFFLRIYHHPAKQKQALLRSNLPGITGTRNRLGLREKFPDTPPLKSVFGLCLKKPNNKDLTVPVVI